MSAAPLFRQRREVHRSCYVKCQELTSRAVLIRRPTAAQRRHFKARLYHPPDLIYDRHRCHDGRRIGRILRLDQFPNVGRRPRRTPGFSRTADGLSRAAAGGHPHRTSPEIGGPYSRPCPRRRSSCVALRRPATRAAASPTRPWFGHPLFRLDYPIGLRSSPRRYACGPLPLRRSRQCRLE